MTSIPFDSAADMKDFRDTASIPLDDDRTESQVIFAQDGCSVPMLRTLKCLELVCNVRIGKV